MDIENRLSSLAEYNIGFEIKQGYYHISINYRPNWSVVAPENEFITVTERDGTYHYICQCGIVTIDELFSAVHETIEYNTEVELKLVLFREKNLELQTLFSTESLEKLKTIEFTFGRQKRKYTRRVKENPTEEEVVVEEEPVENDVEMGEEVETEDNKEELEENV